ncbi:MAG: DUF5627 domain-containing protein [Bacteroidales bacterium]
MMKNRIIIGIASLAMLFSCSNSEVTYPNFDYTTVYFANQYPIRTLELGEDPLVDNSMDNEHKVKITATMGGVYNNNVDRLIDIDVDNDLLEGLYFDQSFGGGELYPMPVEYYELLEDDIIIPAGNTLGGVTVQLKDAFFEDPLSISNAYVIPLVMTNVTGADSILQGKPVVDNPNRCNVNHWEIAPKDYILYVVKYVNPWHANYLRRGEDIISDGTNTITDIRHQEYIEKDEVVNMSTLSLKECILPITIYEDDNQTTRAVVPLKLVFDDDNNCIVESNSSDYNVTGSGKFVKKGEENSIGGNDKDALYLDYTVDLTGHGLTYTTKDTLVCRDRGVAPEYYTIQAVQ